MSVLSSSPPLVAKHSLVISPRKSVGLWFERGHFQDFSRVSSGVEINLLPKRTKMKNNPNASFDLRIEGTPEDNPGRIVPTESDFATLQKIKECSSCISDLIGDAIERRFLETEELMKLSYVSEQLFQLLAPTDFQCFGLHTLLESTRKRPRNIVKSDAQDIATPAFSEEEFTTGHLQSNLPTSKPRKRAIPSPNAVYCHSCHTRDTPEWRRGPDGCKSLCNACGLHYAKIIKKEQKVLEVEPRPISLSMLLN